MVFPGAAPSSSLALNGHRVNPLKVHPPAVVTRQSRAGKVTGKNRRKGEGKRKDNNRQ